MKFVYFDASAGLSGDMISSALLDLGVSPTEYKTVMNGLNLPVRIRVREVERSHLRARKIDVEIRGKGSPARRWKDVAGLIKKAALPASVKERGRTVFEALFAAEAKVHGETFDRVHLHEAGADDALVDILGACWLAETLGIGEFFCSPLNVGAGSVRTAHGILPVPPPAAAELLRGIPVYSAHAQTELVTPTGAALIKTFVSKFTSFPELTYDRIGCGAGGRDIETLPNILRAFYGDRRNFSPDKHVYLLEATIDDANPQVLAAFMDRALEKGALDVHLTPVVMKKNRLGTKLTLLTESAALETLIAAVFTETSSIGLRYFPVERRALVRRIETIRLEGRPIRVKTALLDGRPINVQPEYEDCLALSRAKKLPLKDVLRRAAEAANIRLKG
ncbi:MAG: nickel pincer cofactor biosynthesis protein LarC [Candidatus Aminicenantes bacterium]|nr:nickel pincer cofactor biosynthesis protein LarC [Candidatus Aminicenantes bacterium]